MSSSASMGDEREGTALLLKKEEAERYHHLNDRHRFSI